MIPSHMNIIPEGENQQQNMNKDPSDDKQQNINPPKNAYNLWYFRRKEELMSTRPDLLMSEITRQLLNEWTQLPTEERQPFIDEARRLKEQYMRDHPDYVPTPPLRSKPSNRSIEPAVVSYSLSPYLTPALYAETLMSNHPVSASDEVNKSNDSKGPIPTYLEPSTSYVSPLYFSNPRSAGNQTFNSMAAHNDQSKEVLPQDCKFTYLGQNASKQDLNPEDSVHRNSSTSSEVQHTCPEHQHHKEESPLNLSDITIISSSMDNMPDVENMQLKQSMNEDSSVDNQPYFKRPMNAYMLWCRNRKRELISSRPNLLAVEMIKLMAAEWKQLPAEVKQPFKDRAKRLKEQHRRDHPDMYPPIRKTKPPDKSTEPAVVPCVLSAALKGEAFMSNPPVSAFEAENKSNDPKVSIPTNLVSSTPYITSLYVTKSHCAGSQTFISTAEHNVHSKGIVPYEYKCTYSSQNASAQELNIGDSQHSNSSTSSEVQHTCPEPQHHNEESPLDLSMRKDR